MDIFVALEQSSLSHSWWTTTSIGEIGVLRAASALAQMNQAVADANRRVRPAECARGYSGRPKVASSKKYAHPCQPCCHFTSNGRRTFEVTLLLLRTNASCITDEKTMTYLWLTGSPLVDLASGAYSAKNYRRPRRAPPFSFPFPFHLRCSSCPPMGPPARAAPGE